MWLNRIRGGGFNQAEVASKRRDSIGKCRTGRSRFSGPEPSDLQAIRPIRDQPPRGCAAVVNHIEVFDCIVLRHRSSRTPPPDPEQHQHQGHLDEAACLSRLSIPVGILCSLWTVAHTRRRTALARISFGGFAIICGHPYFSVCRKVLEQGNRWE